MMYLGMTAPLPRGVFALTEPGQAVDAAFEVDCRGAGAPPIEGTAPYCRSSPTWIGAGAGIAMGPFGVSTVIRLR